MESSNSRVKASLGCSALPAFLQGCQPCCSRRCAVQMAEWRLGVVDDNCWSCSRKLRVSCGACCAKTGKVSAHEAQWAGVGRTDAEERPSPPMWSGRGLWLGMWLGWSLCPEGSLKHAATAVSWSWSEVAVTSGGSMRGLAQKRRSNQDACKSSRVGMAWSSSVCWVSVCCKCWRLYPGVPTGAPNAT